MEDIEIDDIIVLLRNASYGLKALKDLIEAGATPDLVADAVWDESQADHSAANSFGKQIKDIKERVDELPSVAGDATLENQVEIIEYVDEVESLLKNATYGLDALKTLIDLIINKNATPYYITYPYLATGITITSSTTAWAYGSYVQVIAANTITETFWLAAIFVDTIETVSLIAQVKIAIGAAGSEVGITELPFTRIYATAVGMQYGQLIVLPVPIRISANTRVAACVADSVTTARNYGIKLIVATGL